MAMTTGNIGTAGEMKNMHSIATEVSSRTKRMTIHPYKVVRKEDGYETLQGAGAVIRHNGHHKEIRSGYQTVAGRRIYLTPEAERVTQTTKITVNKGIERNMGPTHSGERGISLSASQDGKSLTTGTWLNMLG